MERIPRAIYTRELREEAVKLVTEGGYKIPRLGVNYRFRPRQYGAGSRRTERASLRKSESSRDRLPKSKWSLPVICILL